ncbi:g2309 [Coccomyxa viridis]|uniref:G2309 protein n=1 Tax=Coccomyxa viridis TaxID=1274662 RepID=A0ABP1FMA6_9CHLO
MAELEYNAEGIDGEEDGQEREWLPSRDNVVFLIDAQAAMFEEAGLKDTPGFAESDRWFDVAVKVAKEFIKSHIISSDNDRIGVVFYGATETGNQNNFDHVYTVVTLDEPSAQSIRDLENMMGDDFEDKVGSAAEGSPDHLRNGLWAASQLINTGSSRANKRLLIFTRDENPAGTGPKAESYRERIAARAQPLHEANVTVEIFPLTRPGDTFSMTFWNHIIHAGNDEESGVLYEEGSDTMYRLQSLPGFTRQKAYRKRASGRARFLFPGGYKMAVSMYSLVQPATKSSPVFLNALNNEPLKVESAFIDQDTGAVLTEVPKRIFPKFSDPNLYKRIPPIILTSEELRSIRITQDPGLSLLGFKPASCLKPWHTWRQSNFVYPDERTMPGSTTAFIALHEAMLSQERVAICTYVRSRNAEPRLVALMAAQEVKDEYGEQLSPPGMHMLHLCFADDIRTPEVDKNLVGEFFPEPSAGQVREAEKLVEKLTMEDSYVGMYENPLLQRHYQVLEALALAETPPDVEDSLKPDHEWMLSTANDELESFRNSVYGANHNEPGIGKKSASTPKKRPAPEDDPALKDALAQHDYKALAASGKLGKLKVDDLKPYLRAHGLKVTGKKDELIERITEHIDSQP